MKRRLKYLKLFEDFSQGGVVISPDLKKRLNNITKLSNDMEANTIAVDIIDLEGQKTSDGLNYIDVSRDDEMFILKTKDSEKSVDISEFIKKNLKSFYKLNYTQEEIDDFLDAYYDFRPHSKIAA
jgi:hypothetical protein